MAKRVLLGKTEPRLWTRPLRDLHDDDPVLGPATSLGFEVIDFSRDVLGIELWPWQKWLLIHALELNDDGTYRFRRVIVLVGRQNGKTLLASVLAAWWLYCDSARRPDQVPPVKFKVVGVAQTLDIAREPWGAVKVWADPTPDTDEDVELALPALQAATKQVVDTNGKESIVARSRAHYEIRAAKNARGKPAARILMDEMREQKDWTGWNAVSQTTKNFWNGMLFGFSNAGDSSAVVLIKQREAGLADVAAWEQYVEAGLQSAEEYANDHDTSLALFEWSAPEGCSPDDVEGILQANPSIGYGAMTVKICLADIRGMTDAGYRTEVLCQWVSSAVDSFIDVKQWRELHVAPDMVKIGRGRRTVWGVDVSHDRTMTWITAAVLTDSGRPFVTVRIKRAGMMWVPAYFKALADASGFREVALQAKGCPAMELIEPLELAGMHVHALDGSAVALAAGRLRDHARDGDLVIVPQPELDLAVSGAVVSNYADNQAWSRPKSLPVDIAGVTAESFALYALEVLKAPEKPVVPPPPPPAATISREDMYPTERNLATAAF